MKKALRILAMTLILLLLMQPCSILADEAEAPVDTMAVFRELIGTDTILAALYEADISSLRKAIDLRLVSCQELTAYYLERIEAYNSDYNCFISMCTDALDKAKACDEQLAAGTAKGSLFGIPIVLKDNYHYKGYYMTNGHSKADSAISTTTAQVVTYLLSEGAIVLAKTNMSTDAEAAITSTSEAIGETKNAYCTYVASGGSSGGSAVATSLNFAAAGLGTDTNASLRYPAALNGCVTLRGTHGFLTLDGIKKLNRTRDVPGVITRTVYDQALILDAMSGGSTNYAKNLDAGVLSGMRLGVIRELSYPTYANYLYTSANIDDEIAAAFENAITELESLGAEVIEVSIPDIFSLIQDTGDNQAASKYALYQVVRNAMSKADVSALIFPTYLNTPIRSGRDENGKYWYAYGQLSLSNCSLSSSASIPEITVPIGLHSIGAGIGMEIAALKNQEQLLLNIAYAYTEQYDHRSIPEGAQNLYEGEMTLSEIFDTHDTFLQCIDEVPGILDHGFTLTEIFAARQAYQQGKELLPKIPTVTVTIPRPFHMRIVDPNAPPEPESEPPSIPPWVIILAGCTAAAIATTATLLFCAKICRKNRRIARKRQKQL